MEEKSVEMRNVQETVKKRRQEDAKVENARRSAERISRLEKEAVFELLHFYDRSGKQKAKDMVKKAVGSYTAPRDLIFWPTGLLANTLMDNYDFLPDKDAALKAVRTYFDRWIEKKMPVYCMDDALGGEALLSLYRLTGDDRYKAGADRLLNFLYAMQEQTADKTGSLPYRPAQKNGHIYADGIGMICPFLGKYGAMFGESRAFELAVTQIKNMLQYGMSDKMQIPYHGYEYDSGVKLGIIGWGRAVGWLLLGMEGLLSFLPGEHKSRPYLVDEYRNLVKNVSAYQWEEGDFTWQLEAWSGPRDSSATAMIALAVLKGTEAGLLDAQAMVSSALIKRATIFLSSSEKEGKIYECSGECLGFGQYPQIYNAYPWSLGPGLAVLARGGAQ